jgi:hypothetical protein
MSLFVRLNCNFFTHRKTIRLRAALGEDAFWIPPRLWAYAAEHHPDGIFRDYSPGEIATAIGYTGDASRMLRALLQAGFMDHDPLRIHDWLQWNWYHQAFAERAKRAAAARWQKEKGKEKGTETDLEERGEEPSIASSIAPKSTTSEATGGGAKPPLEMWKLRRDRKDLKQQIREVAESCRPDKELLAGLRTELEAVEKGIRDFGKVNGQSAGKRQHPPPTEAYQPTKVGGRNSFAETPKPVVQKFVNETLAEIENRMTAPRARA